MNLYEIDGAIREVLENGISYDEETGEVIFDATDLEQLQADLETKLENAGLYIKNLISEADAIRNEEAALKARREAKTKKADRIAEYVKGYLLMDGRPKYETPRVLMQIRKSEAVEIDPLAKLPDEYIALKYDVKPDKMALKKALKRGEEIEGVRLITNQNITIK